MEGNKTVEIAGTKIKEQGKGRSWHQVPHQGKALGKQQEQLNPWSGTEAEEQKAAGSVSKGYGLGWLQSKDSRYRTGLQSCPLHHKAVFHNHLLGGWLLNINLVGVCFAFSRQAVAVCLQKDLSPYCSFSLYYLSTDQVASVIRDRSCPRKLSVQLFLCHAP